MEARGCLMNLQSELEETFVQVVASNQKMTQDIFEDLTPITEGLQEVNRNLEARNNRQVQRFRQAKIC